MSGKFRSTPARSTITKIFLSAKKPLTASKITQQLKDLNIFVNKTTIYRELEFLLHQGIINEVILDSGKKYYESSRIKHHHHTICSNCGTIDDIFLKNDLYIEEKRLELTKGFKTTNHIAEFFGLCINCQ